MRCRQRRCLLVRGESTHLLACQWLLAPHQQKQQRRGQLPVRVRQHFEQMCHQQAEPLPGMSVHRVVGLRQVLLVLQLQEVQFPNSARTSTDRKISRLFQEVNTARSCTHHTRIAFWTNTNNAHWYPHVFLNKFNNGLRANR